MASKPFDATSKELLELDPAAWLEYVHIRVPDPDTIEVIDADLSTVTAEADKVIRIGGLSPRIIHVELQASHDPNLAERILRYNVLLDYRHKVPVRSTVVLLRKQAEGPGSTGVYERKIPGEDAHLSFRYDVVRAWEQRAEDLLAGGLATLPLVAISDVGTLGINGALSAMSARLKREVSPAQRDMLMASVRMLMGLTHDEAETDAILGRIEMTILGIRGIEESSTYQAIFRKGEARGIAEGMAEGKAEGMAEGEAKGKVEGRIEATREILLRQGVKKLGEPGAALRERISNSHDLKQLETLVDRLLDVSSWDELLKGVDLSA